jgi:hypothetical protein
MPYRHIAVAAAAVAVLAAPDFALSQSLDYNVYRTTVEPIFLLKRPGHARCIVCHGGANNAFSLVRLPPGTPGFTEEQSRKNFATVSNLVVPGKPEESHLLMYPLVPQEGGAAYHSGGRQWLSKNDPHWQTIARWVRGEK